MAPCYGVPAKFQASVEYLAPSHQLAPKHPSNPPAPPPPPPTPSPPRESPRPSLLFAQLCLRTPLPPSQHFPASSANARLGRHPQGATHPLALHAGLGQPPACASPSWNVVRGLRRPVCGRADEVIGSQRATKWARDRRHPGPFLRRVSSSPDLRRFERWRHRRRSMALAARRRSFSALARASNLRRRLSVSCFLPSASIRPEPPGCTFGEYRPNLNPHLSSLQTSC